MQKINLTYLVEDDPIALLIARQVLSHSDYFGTIKSFSNGKKAIDTLLEDSHHNQALPNLIILDLNMPVMDGWEFLDECQHYPEFSQIPVVIFTSSIDPVDIEKSRSYNNVKTYVPKPMDDETVTSIMNVLGKS